MADSLLDNLQDENAPHITFVKDLIQYLEDKKNIKEVEKNTNSQYQIPANDEEGNQLRNEWINGALGKLFKNTIEEKMNQESINAENISIVLQTYLEPLLNISVINTIDALQNVLVDKQNKFFKSFDLIESQLKENATIIKSILLSTLLSLEEDELLRTWKEEMEQEMWMTVQKPSPALGIQTFKKSKSSQNDIVQEVIIDEVD